MEFKAKHLRLTYFEIGDSNWSFIFRGKLLCICIGEHIACE